MLANWFDMCEQVELDFWDWVAKVAERLIFMRLNVADHRDISEEDYCLLKILYKPWYCGELPIYQTKMESVSEIVSQANLFSEETSCAETLNDSGTGFEPIV